MFFGDHGGGTAQIPVDFFITKFMQAACEEEKVFRIGVQQLWYDWHQPVVLR